MSRTLDDALSYASKRGTQLTEWALKAPPPPATNIQPAAPPVGGLNQLSRQQQGLMHATEQYRHFSGWVYSAIRPIAQRIAGQPIRLARKRKRGQRGQRAHKDTIPRNLRSMGDLELIDSHPLLDTLHDPNAVMVRWVLMYVTVCSLELTGKAFLWMRPRSAEEADYPGQWEIWPIPTSWVLPIHEQGRLYAGWAVRPNDAAEAVIVPPEQMGYLYYPDPADPLNAVAPLQAVGRAVASDEALQEGQRRGFLNGLNPGVLITIGRHPDVQGMPGQRPILTKTQRDQIVAAIKAYYRGVTHHDEPLILDGMIENATKLTNTPREMDYLNSGKMTKERISQGFGTNPVVMGQIEGANRASASTADEHFCSSTVNPKIELISECLTAWLCPLFARPGEELVLYVEPATTYDPERHLEEMKFLREGGALTINESRIALGWPAIDGGDVVFVPNGMTPVPIGGPPTTEPPADDQQDPPANDE